MLDVREVKSVVCPTRHGIVVRERSMLKEGKKGSLDLLEARKDLVVVAADRYHRINGGHKHSLGLN